MSLETVYSAMKEETWYLPETVPVELKPATVRQHLKSLVRGMVVIKKTMPVEEIGIEREKGKRKTRAFYMSLQKEMQI